MSVASTFERSVLSSQLSIITEYTEREHGSDTSRRVFTSERGSEGNEDDKSDNGSDTASEGNDTDSHEDDHDETRSPLGSWFGKMDFSYFEKSIASSWFEMDFLKGKGKQRSTRRGPNGSLSPGGVSIISPSFTSSMATVNFIPRDSAFEYKKAVCQLGILNDSDMENVINTRTLGVSFENLQVVGKEDPTAAYQPTVGSVLNPVNLLIGAFKSVRHPPLRNILAGFDGVVRPGEMLLVLGRPGAGCTTLLKVLANRRAEFHSVQGRVHYDSLAPSYIWDHLRGDVTFCGEEDIHLPALSVEETLRFAAKMRAPRERMGTSREEYNTMFADVVSQMLELSEVKDSHMGDHKGLSEGERKRVSIAEALAMRGKITAWDNCTKGLDSRTALELVQTLRRLADDRHVSTIVSLSQAGESLYNEFDKVCLIYEGRMAYFGPARSAKEYFMDLGFVPAHRQTTADFLVSVTNPERRNVSPGANPPRTAVQFAEVFKQSQISIANDMDINSYKKSYVGKTEIALEYITNADGEKTMGPGSGPYLLSTPMQIRVCIRRKFRILRNNPTALVFTVVSSIVQGLIVGSAFFRIEKSTATFFARGSALFLGILLSAIPVLAEIPIQCVQRTVMLRQRQAAMYHPFVEGVAVTAADIPLSFLSALWFSAVFYFTVGLQLSWFQPLLFLLSLFLAIISTKACFRAVAAAFRTVAVATASVGIVAFIFTLYAGYFIPGPTMTLGLKYITFINPFHYAFESMFTNEFDTLRGECSNLIPHGPSYDGLVSLKNQACATAELDPSENLVRGDRFASTFYGFSHNNVPRNTLILIGLYVLFTTAYLVLAQWNLGSSRSVNARLYKRGSKEVKRHLTPDEEIVDAPILQSADEEKASFSLSRAKTFIPTPPETLTWKHIECSVPIPGREEQLLLSDSTGYLAPGKITVLMGPSAASRTALFNVLMQNTEGKAVSGRILLDGAALPSDFRLKIGYCQRLDVHVESSTVREALLFSARLRQPKGISDKDKREFVERCLDICGLTEYADAIIDSLNLEIRKRTSIAVELAAKPKLLLFLDEPLSGLDSQSAWAIVRLLRHLAGEGQAILCTIDQPSAEIFEMFDKLVLLHQGGETVYFGDIGPQASRVINYLQSNGARPCRDTENPAEYMLDVIGAGGEATTEAGWCGVWLRSQERKQMQGEIQNVLNFAKSQPSSLELGPSTTWLYQFFQLTKRGGREYWRKPSYVVAKLLMNIAGGAFIGFTFFRPGNGQQETQNKVFAAYAVMILSVPLSIHLQAPFIASRTVYEAREHTRRMYSWTAFVASQQIVEIGWNIASSSMLFASWFWTVGLDSSRAAYSELMLGVAFPLFYTSLAQAIAATTQSFELAKLLLFSFLSLILLFAGVLVPFAQLKWYRWMYHLSPFKYLVGGIVGQAIGGQEINCSPAELVTLNPPLGQSCVKYLESFINSAGGYLANPDASESCRFCTFRTTDEYLAATFNIFPRDRWSAFLAVLAFACFNLIVTYVLSYMCRFRIKGRPAEGEGKNKRLVKRVRGYHVRAGSSASASTGLLDG